MVTITIPPGKPQRIDVALAATLGASRSQIQRAIKDGRVTVDGQKANAHLLVDQTSAVHFAPEARDAQPGQP